MAWQNVIRSFFSYLSAKIPVFFELRVLDIPCSSQNPEPKGLVCKILRNKELAFDFVERGRSLRPTSLRGLARISVVCSLYFPQ
jgi:hypothetical protein